MYESPSNLKIKKYSLCFTERKSFFIESAKSKIVTYHRTESNKNIAVVKDIFDKLNSLSDLGFEKFGGNDTSNEKYHLSYKIIFEFNTSEELQDFIISKSFFMKKDLDEKTKNVLNNFLNNNDYSLC